ncbi:MAG: hypothetical protein LBL07_16590 [Tannerella sp.]|nr:hypothetical protein [Tannerella sp.]
MSKKAPPPPAEQLLHSLLRIHVPSSYLSYFDLYEVVEKSDCYELVLDVWFHDYIEKFKKKYANNIDITLIDNGEFAPKYRKFQSDAIKVLKEAKKAEGTDKQKSFDLYQEAYNIYRIRNIDQFEYMQILLGKDSQKD